MFAKRNANNSKLGAFQRSSAVQCLNKMWPILTKEYYAIVKMSYVGYTHKPLQKVNF